MKIKKFKCKTTGFEFFAVAILFDLKTELATEVQGDFEGNYSDVWEFNIDEIEWIGDES